MTSGPTQNYADADLGRWRPHPVLAGVVRASLLALPIVLVIAFGLAAAHWFPADRLGISRWAWIGAEVVLSLLLLAGASRVAKKLLPLSSLLKISLLFPDRAPSRMTVALRRYSPEALNGALTAAGPHRRRLTEERDHAERLLDLVAAIGAHDSLTAGHCERVQAYAVLVGRELGLSAQDTAKLSWAALLHDIGKITVPAEILAKTSQPDQGEWDVLATHPHAGRAIVGPLEDWLGPWLDAVDQHHERWDGRGYPRGLSGTQISLGARIVAVVDAYDVITSARSYKAPLSTMAARQELARCAGTQFDPVVVRAMLAVSLGKLRGIAGPLSALSALPGLGSTPLPGLASVTGTLTSAAGAVTAGVLGLTVGLVGPGALPSDAASRPDAHTAVVAAPTSPAEKPVRTAPPTPTPSASPTDPATATAADAPGEPVAETPPSPPPATPSAPPPAPALPTPAPPPAPTPTSCELVQAGGSPTPGANLAGCDLQGVVLTGDLSGVDLTDATLTNAVLTSIDLSGANLTSTTLSRATITSASFDGATMVGTNLSNAVISSTSFAGARLTKVQLNNATIQDSTFGAAVLSSCSTKGTTFTRVSFTGATIDETSLLGAALVDAALA